MPPKSIPISVVAAALISAASCEQEVKTEAEIAVMPVKSYDPFVIAPRLVNQGGAYELLAIIEGVDATAQFAKNLQLLKAQRASLRQLKEQTDQNDEVKKKTGDLEKKLEENIALMLKIYGYKTSSVHIFLPARSALVKVTDGKKELIRVIHSPAEHNKLQSMRAKYAELTKKGEADSDEARALEQKLIEEFGYDVKSTYKINIHKAALYRKVK